MCGPVIADIHSSNFKHARHTGISLIGQIVTLDCKSTHRSEAAQANEEPQSVARAFAGTQQLGAHTHRTS